MSEVMINDTTIDTIGYTASATETSDIKTSLANDKPSLRPSLQPSHQANPWKTKSSRLVYTNPYFTVREDDVIRPDGNRGTYSVVQTRIAVGIVAVNEQRELYLVGQYRYPTTRYSWEIIEGGQEIGESPLETAKRELKEEAGLCANRYTRLGGDLQLSNSISNEIGVVFLAEGLTHTEAAPDGTEILELRRASLDEALAMIRDGVIEDALSIIGICHYAMYINRGQ